MKTQHDLYFRWVRRAERLSMVFAALAFVATQVLYFSRISNWEFGGHFIYVPLMTLAASFILAATLEAALRKVIDLQLNSNWSARRFEKRRALRFRSRSRTIRTARREHGIP